MLECINAKKNYAVTIVNGYNHTSSYPNAMPITMKVLHDKDSGMLLGAQAVGGIDGVDKRLDVMATALAGSMTIDDLAHLDLAYAPPFGAARDIVNTAGFNGINVRQGLVRTVRDLEAAHDAANPAIVIDVRDSMSTSLRPVPPRDGGGCDPTRIVNAPFGELRGRIEELKSIVGNKPVITLCDHGKMSYFASRVLLAHGFDVQSLKGGVTNLPKKKVHLLSAPKAKTSCAVVHGVLPTAPTAASSSSPPSSSNPASNQVLDVCGLACPGPIMQIRKMLPTLAPGSTLTVKASDPGFMNDFPAFCRASSLQCISVGKEAGIVTGILHVPGGDSTTAAAPPAATVAAKAQGTSSSAAVEAPNKNDLALVVFSGELDKVMAAFVMANGALALGGKVTMFFTFWGLNALRSKTKHHHDSKGDLHHHSSVLDKMLTMMLPKNADRLPLSNLNFGGIGAEMMKMQMKQKHLPNLPDLMKSAREGGVRIVGCTMSMDALGVPAEDLIEGIELGGVADFLEASSKAKSTLFI
jgi:peroxiredoxin family protein/TusA-related sulfurtransferase/rhodanese-related sulfurtransferase